MNAIEEQLLRLESAIDKMDSIANDSLRDLEPEIVQMNRDQLMNGTDANGKSMPRYKPNSKAPQAPGPIKLFDKGKWQKGFEVDQTKTELNIFSTDFKQPFLDKRYPTAQGLTPLNQEILKSELTNLIIKEVESMI